MLKNLTKLNILLGLMLLSLLIFKRDLVMEYITGDTKDENFSQSAVIVNDNSSVNEKTANVTPRIAIVILNLGLLSDLSDKAINANSKISLGFTSYSDDLMNQLQESLNQGHDTAVLLPTQVLSNITNDPGQNALLIDASMSENTKKFSDVVLKLMSNDIGLYIPYHSAFLSREDKAQFLLNLLEDYEGKFKFFLYYDLEGASFMTKLLTTSNIAKKSIILNKILDSSLNESAIIASLNSLAEMSVTTKSISVGAIYPTKLAMNTLEKWISNNTDKVEIVSLSTILQERSMK